MFMGAGQIYKTALFISRHNRQKNNNIRYYFSLQKLLEIPKDVENCEGCAAVHDIQMSEVSPNWFKVLSPIVPVFW